jgi:hypothetical protein
MWMAKLPTASISEVALCSLFGMSTLKETATAAFTHPVRTLASQAR